MKKALLALSALAVGCEPAPCEQQWGYWFRDDQYPAYSFEPTAATASGIMVDAGGQNVDLEKLDRYVAEVEACLGVPIDRSSFRVKVAGDWVLSCEGEEVLPMALPDRYCKGKAATDECPCRYRAVVQCPNLIVATPNLRLLKDALIRFLTGTQNPWETEALAACANPT